MTALLLLACVLGTVSPREVAAQATVEIAILGLRGDVPVGWPAERPATSMRVVQHRVPGPVGEATLAVFWFGRNQGGSASANIARWTSQFSTADGGPVHPTIETTTVAAMPVTLVTLRGSYARGVGMGPIGAPVPDQMLLAAVVESPEGNLYFQLWGPAATVTSALPDFRTLVLGLR
ncbi:MAG: hypothetical protein H6983_10470 [Ectothiorhodospiraceae bacterium]|nr:hypothetical protein [Chromatiales bacterium]MCP5154580.1 hypothetical protein [Ectothiorhodospiraceae bacterium]